MSLEKVTIHFHGGTKAEAIVTADDIANENERLEELKVAGAAGFDVEPVEDVFELVESAITVPPRPRWAWIGDVYVFTQAVCGFEMREEAA